MNRREAAIVVLIVINIAIFAVVLIVSGSSPRVVTERPNIEQKGREACEADVTPMPTNDLWRAAIVERCVWAYMRGYLDGAQ